MNIQRAMNVFDLDGVITNPEDSRVNIKLLDQMHAHLVEGNVIAVNTGRSYDWVEHNLVDYFTTVGDEKVLPRLILVCEKGGEMVTLSRGKAKITPSRFALPRQIYQATEQLFRDLEPQLDTMFWDGTKRTMATIEKLPTADLRLFHDQQKQLAAALNKQFSNENVRIDATTIATDIESVEAGKYAGGQLIFEWAKANHPDVDEFVCYGDSVSDYAMAQCFADQGLKAAFVYVGKDSEGLPHDARVRLTVTTEKFDAGTLEYLSVH